MDESTDQRNMGLTKKGEKDQMTAERKQKSPDEIVKRMIELAEKSYNCSQIMMIMAPEQEGKQNADREEKYLEWREICPPPPGAKDWYEILLTKEEHLSK